MPKVDDELSRRLHRADRPVDGDGLFEGLERRRSHRERVRKVQAGMLAFAVVASTAGGFVALRSAFDADERDPGQFTPFPSNGAIVFSRTSSGSEHLYLIEPDGTDLRQITDWNGSDQFATWSPDGRRIVFLRQDRASIRLYVLDLDSGDSRPITPPSMGVYRPAWSPDGELIAFAGVGADVSGIWVVHPDGSGLRRITEGPFNAPDAPRWSPDGSTIAFTSNLRDSDGGYREGWDVYLVGRDGSGLRNLTETPDPEQSESPIGWLPDGNLLLSESPGTVSSGPGLPIQMGRWLEITPAGDVVRTVLEEPVNTEDHLQEPRLSPDGRSVIFDSARGGTQEVWFVELTTMEFTQVTTSGGWLPAWQPIQIGSGPSPTPEPSISPDPEPEGRDIGLAFNLCKVRTLGGIDFLGDGTGGRAWTGTKVLNDGACPTAYDARYGVAVDFTGDGVADSWSGETIEYCGACELWKAIDLNGDGRKELMVIVDNFSIMHYGVYTLLDVDGRPEIEPFRIGEPGHPEHELDPGKPFTFWVGGDAGLSDWFSCETLPEFWLTGTESPIDPAPGAVKTVHRTHVSLMTDGIAHILFADTYTVPAETHLELPYTSPNHSDPDCGIGVGPG